MEYRRFGNTIVARIDRGEEVLEQVKAIAPAEQIKRASVQALGAVGEFPDGVFHKREGRGVRRASEPRHHQRHLRNGHHDHRRAGGSLPQRGDRSEPVPILKICVKSAHGFAAVRIFLLPTFLIPIDIVGI